MVKNVKFYCFVVFNVLTCVRIKALKLRTVLDKVESVIFN